jgi:hypothetical protein
MRLTRRWSGCISTALLLLVGCEGANKVTEITPSPTARPLYVPGDGAGGAAGAFTTFVGGEQFYGDDQTDDLIPTSRFQARIENYTSSITSFSCTYSASSCTTEMKASHTGMWHHSSQSFNWKIADTETGDEQGVQLAKSDGNGCASWATLGMSLRLFCTNKRQENTATGTYSGQPCSARASLTTDHHAEYSWLGGLSVGTGNFSITPGTFGENDKFSSPTPQTWTDSGCGQCNDPSADNYNEAGDCTYGTDVCDDPEADNFGDSGQCTYPPAAYCDDPDASNYGDQGDCNYDPPSSYCDDPDADNYGAPGACTYPPPPDDPWDPGDPGGGGGYDPCDSEINYDPECDDPEAMSMLPAAGSPGSHSSAVRISSASSAAGAQRSYYVVFADGWQDKSVLAMVGRFKHHAGYVDAIYLPSSAPSAEGMAWALRALQRDRTAARGSDARRLIRIGPDGTQQFVRSSGKKVKMKSTRPFSPFTLNTLNKKFARGILTHRRHVHKTQTKNGKRVQAFKWPLK